MIKKFGCKNIKAIREYSQIEIRPITVFMGENSSGKSSMLQGLSLLAVNKIFGNDIKRIKYNNPFSKFGDNDSFKDRGEEVLLSFEIEDDEDKIYRIELCYEDEVDNNEYGLLKEMKINDIITKFSYENEIVKCLMNDLESIRHIGMLRDIEATYDYSNDYIGYFGERYRKVAKSLHSKVYVNKAIKYIFGYEVKKIDKDTGDFYLADHTLKKSLGLNMFGTSVSSTMPILTQYAKNNEKEIRDKYRLTIVEEPEINEHPLSQSRFIEALFPKNRPKKHFNIIETHSDHIVNKLRYMVFKKQIKPSDIIIYYKKRDCSKFESIEIDKNGLFSNEENENIFPSGFYDATLEEIFEIETKNL